MSTLLVSVEELARPRLRISGDSYRHLFRARRLANGDTLRLVDGEGRARWARVAEVDRREAVVELGDAAPPNEPERRVSVVTAVPRPARARWLVEKATEIGVAAVRFLRCERSARGLQAPALERLQRVARAAVEQSERSLAPAVTGVHRWDELPELLAGAEERWLLRPGASAQVGPSGSGGSHSVALLVGPEGGWTVAEVEALESLGARGLGLGPTTLRVETAAVVGAARLLADNS